MFNEFDTLNWRKFSRELDEIIKDSYKSCLLNLVFEYILKFKINVYEKIFS